MPTLPRAGRRAALALTVGVLALAGSSLFVSGVSTAATPAGYHSSLPDPATMTVAQKQHEFGGYAGEGVPAHLGAADRRGDAMELPMDGSTVPGLDVSGWQGDVDWSSVAADGAKFAYVKATEGTDYTNPYFSQQYTGAYDAGLVHGAYVFANPNSSSGAAQADYFVDNGGGWSEDGRTFPGMLDLEWSDNGTGDCYGLSQSGMGAWITSFNNEYHARTGRWAMIYTATSWWNECVGGTINLSQTNPLMLACYCSSVGSVPSAFDFVTIWQYADSGTFPGDQDQFQGDQARVVAMANG